MDISRRIVITFVVISLIPVLVIAGLATYTIFNLSSQNAGDAASALDSEESENLLRLTNDTALFIQERMQSYMDGVYIMEEYCEDLFNGRISATPVHSYYWDSDIEPLSIPGLEHNEDYEYVLDNGTVIGPGMISFDVSCYYMPRDHYPTPGNPLALDPTTEYFLDISSNMDDIYKSLHEMNSDYIWLYMGFNPSICSSHLFRNYPYDTLLYFQLDEDGNAVPPADDYDPPAEEWYTNAAALAISSTSVAITGPYGDPSTGLVISMGRPVYYDNGTLIGVVSADVTLDTVLSSVLDIQVLDSGYGYLLSASGNVIAHRNFTLEGQTINELEFGTDTGAEVSAFIILLNTALVEGEGQHEFYKQGEDWLVTFKEVPNTGFLLATVVPMSEVVEPATNILNVVLAQTGYLTLILGLVLAGVGVVVSAAAYYRGKSVVEPIKEMTSLVEKMSKQDFTRSIRASGAMYEEIGTTVDALLSFQEACRFGNQAFIRGDLNRALANYQNLLEISRRLDIEIGVQTMYLNIGNVFRQRGNTADALDHYRKALSIAEGLLQKSKENGTEESDAMDRIASACHNIALALMDQGDYDGALAQLEKAEAIDETLGNKRGLARRYDAMGLVMLRQGRHSQSKSKLTDAKNIADAEGYVRGQAYASYHLGELYEGRSDWKNAKASYKEAIQNAERTEEYWLQVYAMQHLADVLDQLDEPSHETRSEAEKLRRSIRFKKSVVFVIDYSGSMKAQDRIEAAVAGAREILDSQINPQDDVSIIAFNVTYQQVIPLTRKGEYADPRSSPVRRALDSLRYPNYSTALYDALGKALEDLNQIVSSEHRWVIALSDGQDNSSKRFSLDALKGIVTEKDRARRNKPLTIEGFIRDNHLDINLIIIGVGNELKNPIDQRVISPATGQTMTFEELLKSVCDSIPQGKYLSVVDSKDVRLDIERAFQEVGVMMAQLEVGGTTDDF